MLRNDDQASSTNTLLILIFPELPGMRPLTRLPVRASTLCRACVSNLSRPRFITTSTSTVQPRIKQPPSSGLAPIPTRNLLSVSGADASKFLQGLTTGNLIAPDGSLRTDPFYAALLAPHGRLLFDVFIYPVFKGGEPEYMIEGDANHIIRLLKHIKRYALRAAISFRKIEPEEMTVWQAWDHSGGALDAGKLETATSEGAFIFEDPRVPGLGHRILQQGDKTPALDLDTTDPDIYTIRRYLSGVAEGQDEIPFLHSLPMEFNMDYMNGIDFRKGCYVGQELTVRTKHRGIVRKRVLPCLIYGEDEAPPSELHYGSAPHGAANEGADVVEGQAPIYRSPKSKRDTGRWLTGLQGSNLGLALCRLESMTDVKIIGEGQWTPENEFEVHWGGRDDDPRSVKVKAFVPEWLRTCLDASKPEHK